MQGGRLLWAVVHSRATTDTHQHLLLRLLLLLLQGRRVAAVGATAVVEFVGLGWIVRDGGGRVGILVSPREQDALGVKLNWPEEGEREQ